MKKKNILLIYGDGGHKKEMELFINTLPEKHSLNFISIGPKRLESPVTKHYNSKDIRDKKNRFKSLYLFITLPFSSLFLMFNVLKNNNIDGALSTGPGIAIIPFFLCRILGIKTVFIETFCRFNSRSLTGIFMHKIAARFLVQNKELLQLYPKAKFSGRL